MAGEQGEEGKEDGEEPPCLDAGSEHQIENAEKDLTNRDEISLGHCHTFTYLIDKYQISTFLERTCILKTCLAMSGHFLFFC